MPFIDTQSTEDRTILDFRRIGIRDVPTMGRYVYRYAHRENPMHDHGDGIIEISFLESGKQIYSVGGKEYVMNGGDLFVTLPHEEHGTGGHPEERGVMYWTFVWLPEPGATFLDHPAKETEALFRRLLSMEKRLFRGRPEFKPLLERIFDCYRSQRDELRLVNIKNYLMRYVLDVVDCAYSDVPDAVSPAIRRILDLVDEKIEEALPLQVWADEAGLSLSRFKARFKKEVGYSPADYVARRKIERAQELLRHDAANITEIAFRLGFSTSQYFAVTFKKYTGMTPREYRRQSRISE